MKCLLYLGITPMKEDTSAQLCGRDELHGGLFTFAPLYPVYEIVGTGWAFCS